MSQPTLKHGDWAKIIEPRQKQNNSKAAKSASLKYISFGAILLTLMAIFYWTNLSASQSQPPLSEESQTRVVRYFSKQFMMGTWQLDEVKFSEYGVVTNIRVPKKLNMEGEVLSNYVKHSLCPPASSLIWKDIKTHTLTMNLFVSLQRKGKKAQCANPNTQRNS
ncbi:hypothetical protein CWB73_11465 [Pseudoalteromonas phenolica]|uniref:Uncharacterized protein n=1 Tax=Pseudoalteromonas phenolica TaxID=161398 RepID=A0A5S3YSA7_9GAMM|nr:hypothetical protein [Pseudoalteromonas phenolica]TMP80119.1 hypothetical protein CWB73_11465 [Pseudoalteromonas phenolica]